MAWGIAGSDSVHYHYLQCQQAVLRGHRVARHAGRAPADHQDPSGLVE